MVLKYSIYRMHEMGILSDLVIILEQTYPFRASGFIDHMIVSLVRQGLDSMVPVKSEFRSIWRKLDSETKEIGEGFMPRQFKQSPAYISLLGLGCVTHPIFIREERILGDRVGFQEVEDAFSTIEVRDDFGIEMAGKVINDWWSRSP